MASLLVDEDRGQGLPAQPIGSDSLQDEDAGVMTHVVWATPDPPQAVRELAGSFSWCTLASRLQLTDPHSKYRM